jgi:hypothetical protein
LRAEQRASPSPSYPRGPSRIRAGEPDGTDRGRENRSMPIIPDVNHSQLARIGLRCETGVGLPRDAGVGEEACDSFLGGLVPSLPGGTVAAWLADRSRAGEDFVTLNYSGRRAGVQWVARAGAISCTRCRSCWTHRRAAKSSPSGIAVLVVVGEAWLGILALVGCWRLARCPSPFCSPIELAHELDEVDPHRPAERPRVNDVQPPFAPFAFRYEGLRFAETFRDLRLSQPLPLSGRSQATRKYFSKQDAWLQLWPSLSVLGHGQDGSVQAGAIGPVSGDLDLPCLLLFAGRS